MSSSYLVLYDEFYIHPHASLGLPADGLSVQGSEPGFEHGQCVVDTPLCSPGPATYTSKRTGDCSPITGGMLH